MKHVETISLPHDLSELTETIDVRSPSEFAEDHLPGAINLPVLDDLEREKVGTIYNGNPFEARKLGAQLISKNIATHIENHFSDKTKSYAPLVYCWRGGMRSNSFAHVLRSIGWRARLLDGGYKAYRTYLRTELDRLFSLPELKLTVLAGPTGVAKTRLLHTLKEQGAQVLDLEALANHKGSVLGLEPETFQPSQKMFETHLAETLAKLDITQPIFTEAESNRIGLVHCPPGLWQKLGEGSVVDIKLSLEQRARFLLDDYPYFTDQPEHLKGLLQRLTKLRGNEQIRQWNTLIDEGQWYEFVLSILRDHYDLVYRKAGDEKSNYAAPSSSIQLSDFSKESLTQAADELIKHV